jgi:hypothetical protein
MVAEAQGGIVTIGRRRISGYEKANWTHWDSSQKHLVDSL